MQFLGSWPLVSHIKVINNLIQLSSGKVNYCEVIPEVCEALWLRLQPTFMPVQTECDWGNIAIEYERKWQFANCIGSLDGKHVVAQAPKQSGTLFYN